VHAPLPEPSTRSSSAQGAGLPNRRPPGPPLTPHPASADRLLPSGWTDEQYIARFLEEFGATEAAPTVFRDKTGDAVVIGRELFKNAKTGALKVSQRGHTRELMLLADALKDPDEVWVRLEWQYAQGKAVVRRRYIGRFQVEGEPVVALAVFEVGSDGWTGITTFAPDAANPSYLDSLRLGLDCTNVTNCQ